jgi:ATP-dependent Clp protease ATP-binding subunit ClpA
MDFTVIKELGYQDSFKGSILPEGRVKPLQGNFKVMSNNIGGERMSVKSKDGQIHTVKYSDIQRVESAIQKGHLRFPGGGKITGGSSPNPDPTNKFQQGKDRAKKTSMLKKAFGGKPSLMEILQTLKDVNDEYEKALEELKKKYGEPTTDPTQTEPKQEEKKEEVLSPKEIKKDIDLDELITDDYENELLSLIKAGVKNIWLVGPAGCGKTTITKNVSNLLKVGLHVISCGLGTSASEFIGYKYPARETTAFAEYYAMPSIILLDEFTALDPAVAQISNSALANGFIMTTNGKVERHPDCIIVATSNTFGQGASRQYVANNQLDASTIDRFVGGILEMNYSSKYESQFDSEVYDFIKKVRKVITNNALRRVASTRMLQEGCKLKDSKISNWKYRLVTNWTKAELDLLRNDSDTKQFVTATNRN